MQILSVTFEFKINFATIFSFLLGILIGMILLFLIYVLTSLKKIEEKNIIVSQENLSIESKDIIEDIENAKKRFLEMRKKENEITWNNIKTVNLDLIISIAQKFHPNSKQPLAELTFEELILLDRYIMDKLEEIIDKTGIKFLKKMKLSLALKFINIKNDVDNNVVVKTGKKMKIDKIVNIGFTVFNALNPVIWFRKLVINPGISKITTSICLYLISIIGQETYHVYSKQAFMDTYSDEEMNNLIRLINEENIKQNEEESIDEQVLSEEEKIKDIEEDKEIEDLSYLVSQTTSYRKSIFSKKKKKKKVKNT